MAWRWFQWNLLGLKPSPYFPLMVVFCELLILTCLGPVMPGLQIDFFHSASEASMVSGIFSCVSALIGFALVPVLGSLSDRHGRQPFILLAIACMGVHVWVLAVGLNMWFYFFSYIFSAISVFGLTNAYIADITTQEERPKFYGLMMVCAYISIIVGAIPSLFLPNTSIFVLAASVAFMNVLYVLIFLPESLHYQGVNYKDMANVAASGNGHLYSELQVLNAEATGPTEPTSEPIAFNRVTRVFRRTNTASPLSPSLRADVEFPSLALDPDGAVVKSERVPSVGPEDTDISFPEKSISVVTALRVSANRAGSDVEDEGDFAVSLSDRPEPTADAALNVAEDMCSPAITDRVDSSAPSGSTAFQQNGRHTPWVTLKYAFHTRFLAVMSCLTFLTSLVEFAIFQTMSMYLSDVMNFSKQDIALLMMMVGVSSLGIMLTLFQRWLLEWGERKLIMFSVFANAVRILLICFCTEKWQLIILQLFAGFGMMSFPANVTLLSRHTPAAEQGVSQGALVGVRQLTQGFGPLMFSGIFSYFISHNAFIYFPQAPFVLGVVFLMLALICAYCLPDEGPPSRRSSRSQSGARIVTLH